MPQLLGLTAALLCPLVMFVGLFLVLRTPGLKWRIAWAVLCFVGVGAFWMRASDGAWGFVPAAINILGTGQQAGFYKASFPLGALVSMFICVSVRRVRLQAAQRRDDAAGTKT
ncbi:hypothetical protein [Caulobacter sp. BK020]|uniref:hypothetical protein n=1 Tax=Caulobacter sp. BK020 TaxID=2512117 RepID=UPI0010442D0C|nr:hypothetical protein [Caulobacter sp. BK020]TCS18102.1 hypothetical protein EV278_10183 [Caulobacter sp. BK020]